LQNDETNVHDKGCGQNDHTRQGIGPGACGNTDQLRKKGNKQCPGAAKDHFWQRVTDKLPPQWIRPNQDWYRNETQRHGQDQQATKLPTRGEMDSS
jgi:hypothetical protein